MPSELTRPEAYVIIVTRQRQATVSFLKARATEGKTDPSVSTLEKIANALGVSLSELFAISGDTHEVSSQDKTIMEKVRLIESLSDEEKQTLFTILDAFVGKRKLKDTLSNVLNDVVV